MLSLTPNIRTLRDVCKVLTGRTSGKAIARINRFLHPLRPEYFIEVGLRGALGGGAVVRNRALQFIAKRPDGSRVTEPVSLLLPTSFTDLLKALLSVDKAAEGVLGLNYGGGARAPSMLSRS